MADDVSVRFLNQEQVLATIRELAGQIGTQRGVPQKVVAIESIKGIQQGFRDQVSPDGVPWKPLKSRIGGMILQDHRILYHSITSQIAGDTVTIGTNDKRAAMLHYGGLIRPKGKYLAIMVPGVAYRGSLRTTYPDAFVLKLGGKDYGYDRLWLVRKATGAEEERERGSKRNSFSVEDHGKLQFIALLVKSVEEPGRPFIGLSLMTQDRIVARLSELARKAWGDGNAPDTSD